jgi:hypothetical protein
LDNIAGIAGGSCEGTSFILGAITRDTGEGLSDWDLRNLTLVSSNDEYDSERAFVSFGIKDAPEIDKEAIKG